MRRKYTYIPLTIILQLFKINLPFADCDVFFDIPAKYNKFIDEIVHNQEEISISIYEGTSLSSKYGLFLRGPLKDPYMCVCSYTKICYNLKVTQLISFTLKA